MTPYERLELHPDDDPEPRPVGVWTCNGGNPTPEQAAAIRPALERATAERLVKVQDGPRTWYFQRLDPSRIAQADGMEWGRCREAAPSAHPDRPLGAGARRGGGAGGRGAPGSGSTMTNPRWKAAGYRWRSLTPEQGIAIRTAWMAGVHAPALAAEYGVSVRTIYREVKRANAPIETATLFGQRATFVEGDDGEPVRMTPWVPA